MKILFIGDVHWCSQSSLVKGRGEVYTQRLDNLVNSVNWAEKLADETGCEMIVYAGDFFDQPTLNAEEISALNSLVFSNVSYRFFLVGNHELGRGDRNFSSAHLFNHFPNSTVIQGQCYYDLPDGHSVLFLPYYLEKDRPPILRKCDYIFSHNDLKGIQMGKFLSQEGYSQEEIESKCKYFFNGHLHNGTFVGDKIINIGNLSGQNFGEDATVYSHNVVILDTDTDKMVFYENPYAFNFYKLGEVKGVPNIKLKPNAVVTATVSVDDKEARDWFDNHPNILCKRILFNQAIADTTLNEEFDVVNHLEKFIEFITETMEMTDIVKEELRMVTQG